MRLSTSQKLGPLLIGTGLLIVLAAQILPEVPVAAAIALIGCGAVTVMRHQRWQLLGSIIIYTTLVGLALGAEIHLRWDAIFVGDGVIALLLLLSAIHSAFQRTDSASIW